MTRHFTRASSQYFNVACSPPVAPYTLACHFRLESFVGLETLMLVDGASGYDLLFVDSSGVLTDQVGAAANNSTIAGVAVGKWHTGILVCSATNSRVVYLDGNPGTTNTDSEATTKNSLQIGAYGGSHCADGIIATPAIWNCALTASEVRAFAGGVHPTRIRPTNLWMPPGDFDALRAGGPVMQTRAGVLSFTSNNAVGIANLAPPVEAAIIVRRRRASASSGRALSGAITEANDGLSASAFSHAGAISGALTEAADAAAVLASVKDTLSAAITEAGDATSISVKLKNSAASALVESNDAAIIIAGGEPLKIAVIAPYRVDDTIGTKTLQVYQFSGGSLIAQGPAQTTGFTALPNIPNGWMVTLNATSNGGYNDFCGLAVFSNITPSGASLAARAVPLYSAPRSLPSTINIVAVKQFGDSDVIVTPGYQLYDIDRNAVGSHVTAGIVSVPGVPNCYAAKISLTPDANGGAQYFIEWDGG